MANNIQPNNIQEFVVNKVIDYIENSDTECAILKQVFKDQYLNCKMCNLILVPVNKRDKKYQDRWICPCDFCFIEDCYSTYDNIYHRFRSRGLGEHICDEFYCKACVRKHGYGTFFVRYNTEKQQNEDYDGDFHEPDSVDRKTFILRSEFPKYLNVCKECDKN